MPTWHDDADNGHRIWIGTDLQLADIDTKALTAPKIEGLLKVLVP